MKINKRILTISISLAIILIVGSLYFDDMISLFKGEKKQQETKISAFANNYDISPPEIKQVKGVKNEEG